MGQADANNLAAQTIQGDYRSGDPAGGYTRSDNLDPTGRGGAPGYRPIRAGRDPRWWESVDDAGEVVPCCTCKCIGCSCCLVVIMIVMLLLLCKEGYVCISGLPESGSSAEFADAGWGLL